MLLRSIPKPALTSTSLVYRARPSLSPSGNWGRGEGWARKEGVIHDSCCVYINNRHKCSKTVSRF